MISESNKVKIYPTRYILKDLDYHIKNKLPFSTVRFGDAVYGILASFLCPEVIDKGKWAGRKGRKLSNSLLSQLTIPTPERMEVVKKVVQSANNASYCDSYEAYYLLNTSKKVGIVGRNWKNIHEGCGITNTNYCSCFLHYFSIIENEYNLFNVMKDRKIFCITNRINILPALKNKSGAKVIEGYRIPRRGRKGEHYKKHYKEIMRLIRLNSKNFDLFLVGGGLLGKIYCDEVKRNSGCSFDCGRLFDFWANARKIDSRPKRFLNYIPEKMLCIRIRAGTGDGVW